MLVHLEEIAVVDDGVNHILDVVRLHGIGGNERIERGVGAVGGIGGRAARRIVQIIRAAESSSARESWPGIRRRRCATKCATPLVALCVMAPPSSCLVTSSCVTVLMTSGPVTNM